MIKDQNAISCIRWKRRPLMRKVLEAMGSKNGITVEGIARKVQKPDECWNPKTMKVRIRVCISNAYKLLGVNVVEGWPALLLVGQRQGIYIQDQQTLIPRVRPKSSVTVGKIKFSDLEIQTMGYVHRGLTTRQIQAIDPNRTGVGIQQMIWRIARKLNLPFHTPRKQVAKFALQYITEQQSSPLVVAAESS